MSVTPSKAFDVDNGVRLADDGAHISSGPDVPSHSASDGDIYFRHGSGVEAIYRRINGVWVLLETSIFMPDLIDVGDTYLIPTNRQMRVYNLLTISGNLIVDGILVVD